MVKIKIDKSLCTGCGLCADMCPEIFQLGADGLAEVIKEGECGGTSMEDVVASCPVNAIILEG